MSPDPAFLLGAGTFLALFVILLTRSLGWWLGGDPGWWSLAAGLIAFVLALGLSARERWPHTLYLVLGSGALLALAYVVLRGLQDPSWDGPNYHAPAVLEMLDGWNPYRGETGRLWVDHYPASAWTIRAALVAAAGGDLAAGRLLLPVAALATGFLAQDCMRKLMGAGSWRAALVAILLVANPIVLSQFWTDHVDGLLGIFALALLLALLRLVMTLTRWSLVLVVCLAVLTATTKTAGLYYVFVLCAVMLAWGLWRYRHVAGNRRRLVGRFALVTLLVTALTLLIAYRPYVTNLRDHQNLIHPPMAFIMGQQQPANLADAGSFTRALYLLFSPTSQRAATGEALQLKWGEWNDAAWQGATFDSRSGGFGPLFGIQFMLAAILWLSGAGRAGTERSAVGCAALACLVATLAFPENWWARFVPLAWACSVFLAAGVRSAGPMVGIGQAVFVFLAVLNALPFIFNGWEEARSRTAQFEALVQKLATVGAVSLHGSHRHGFNVTYGHELSRAGIGVIQDRECVGQSLTYYDGALKICYGEADIPSN